VENLLQTWFRVRVEFSVLGPLEVRRDGQAVVLGGPKQRALLAMLLLHANEVVSRDRLVDALWGGRAAASAHRSLDSYVSRLRRAIGGDRLERRRPGYLLHVEPGELDLERFEQLAAEGRRQLAGGSAESAALSLRSALDLWRGSALADVPLDWLTGEVERLEELRIEASEEWIEANLVLDRAVEVVPELERLVREHPLRERLTGQLMLALYRSGRQAEALDAYRSMRRRLAEELGLEPGPQLGLLEQQILQHDASLGVSPSRPAAAPRRRRARRQWLLAGVAVAAASVAMVVGLGTGRSREPIAVASSSRLLELSADARPTGQGASLDSAATAAAADGHAVWLSEPDSSDVVRVDATSGNTERIPVGGQPGALAIGGGAVWAVDSAAGGSLLRIDPSVDRVTQRISLGGAPAAALAFGDRKLWVADPTDESVLVFDPLSGSPERTIPLTLHPTALAFAAGALWVADYDADSVAEIDPRSGQPLVTVPNVGSGPAALAVDPRTSTVWVANFLDSSVSRINSDTGQLAAAIPVGSGPTALALAGSTLWVANEYSQTITPIDPVKNDVRQAVPVGGAPTALAAAGRVFVATRPLGAHRGGTLVLLHTRPTTIDPALQLDLGPTISDGLTRDDLLTNSHAGGSEGERLVPDLALSVPAATDGGLEYTFRLRPGIRYSDGRPVLAGDFRRELERVFRLGSPGKSYFADIIGAATCTRTHCNLARGIVTNDKQRTITFRLRAPSVDLLSDLTIGGLASAVPPGTPFHDIGNKPIPGSGPYKVATANAREIRYVRNPYFREWSHAAQPAGNPDQIIMRFGLTAAQEVKAVEQGRADYTADGIPGELLPAAEARFAAQLHDLPNMQTDFLQLNTTIPPFDDVRVRRAFNLAIDRGRIASFYGGIQVASPTCQVLPPGLTGYVRYCPWTQHVNAEGAWHGPDLSRARALVAASHARGDRIAVWESGDDYIPPADVSYAVSVLRRLGFRAHIHHIPRGTAIPEHVFEHQVQATPPAWADSTPYGFFGTWFLCSAPFNHRWFCNARLDRAIRSAETLETTNPAAASRAWTRLDHGITDQAAWVPLVNPTSFDFVSARVRNYQSSPAILADQLWIAPNNGRR
jgi:ABC-type transport system substrate-binding protein/DNA-binding SARP family transcriptional activator